VRPTVKNEMRRAFYSIIAQIPRGKVATYGQVAELAGYPGRARQVGYALAGMPEEMDLPWHRVINAQGQVSPRTASEFHRMQRDMLVAEGVPFRGGRIELRDFRWMPGGNEA